MPVSPAVREDLLERLNKAAPVDDRGMFGGVGLYSQGRFFALIDNDILYFKVDETTRPDFIKAGMGPFMPFGPGKASLRYYQVPAEVIGNGRKLKAWVDKALSAAERAAEKRAAKGGGKDKAVRKRGVPRTAGRR
jgi:TfoX/Sxy family transcriptional regulator of competence genes